MKPLNKKLMVALFFVSSARLNAQQNPATIPPTTAPTANAAPCIPPPPQKCGFLCREEQKLRLQATIQSCRLTKGNVCDSPEFPTNHPKPCPAPVVPPPNTAPAIPATVPESKPLISDDGKHLYVCPKNSSRVADLPVCQTADHSFVPMIDIPVPAGALMKGGPANSGTSAANANAAANNTTSTTPLPDGKPNPNAVTTTSTH